MFRSLWKTPKKLPGLFRRLRSNTLRPMVLVNELFLRLHDRRSVHWEGPSHFFGAAAQMMRRLLVDHARHRRAGKRGGDAIKNPLMGELAIRQHQPCEMLDLDQALRRLQAMEPRQAQIADLRFFVGLNNSEIAKTLGIGLTAVKADLRIARAWLVRELRPGGESGSGSPEGGPGSASGAP